MESDWSVELGADDPVLEMTWSSPDGVLSWRDLRRHPELIAQLTECEAHAELIEPLRKLNSLHGHFLTAKCDAFDAEPTEPAEELFGSWRVVSYIDLLFADDVSPASGDELAPIPANFDFALHEQFARDLHVRLNEFAEGEVINASVEIVVRRCIYNGSRDGFYFSVYVIGYGETADESRRHWAQALNAVATSATEV